MKKCLLLFVAASFFFVNNTSAQIKKGATLINLSLSGTSSKTEQEGTIDQVSKGKSLNTTVGFGKAIRENLVLGIRGAYSRSSSTSDNSSKVRTRNYGAGVFMRKYHPLGKSGFYLFGQGGLDFRSGKDENITPPASDPERTNKLTSGQLAFTPGLSYAVSRWLQLEVAFNDLVYASYSHRKISDNGNTFTSREFAGGLNTSGATQLSLGFAILIN